MPGAYAAVQVPGHEIPPGALVTCPPPDPVVVTVTCGLVENHAVQARSPVTVTVIVGDAPLQAPLQPVKVCPGPGVAVRVTADCRVNRPVQAGPQSTPVGELVTVPAPRPSSPRSCATRRSVAWSSRSGAPPRRCSRRSTPATSPAPRTRSAPPAGPGRSRGTHLAARDLPDALAVRVVPVPGRRAGDLGLLLQAVRRVPVAAAAVRPCSRPAAS